VEIVEHKCEGLVSINSLLEYDDFRHMESEYSLVGRRSGRQFRMGDKLTIRVVSANLAKRQMDYEWVITASEAAGFPPALDGEATATPDGRARGGRPKAGGSQRRPQGGRGKPSSPHRKKKK
jgi:ribonuclease R